MGSPFKFEQFFVGLEIARLVLVEVDLGDKLAPRRIFTLGERKPTFRRELLWLKVERWVLMKEGTLDSL